MGISLKTAQIINEFLSGGHPQRFGVTLSSDVKRKCQAIHPHKFIPANCSALVSWHNVEAVEEVNYHHVALLLPFCSWQVKTGESMSLG